MNQDNNISCPECGHSIDVNEILYHQVHEELKKNYEDELAKEKADYRGQVTALEAQRQELEQARERQQSEVDSAIKEGLKRREAALKASIKAEAEEENEAAIQCLEDEIKEKSKKLKQFNKAQSEIEKLKREKEELGEAIEAELEKKHSEQLAQEKALIRKTAEEKSELKILDRDKIISQLTEQLKEAHTRAEQGSIQLRGEVQELAIEQWLANSFPLDAVNEIKKGVKGADCVQTVNTHSRLNCGKIYFESKRTKHFQETWIEKFKNDMRETNADIGVLVTQSMPKDMERMGLRDGIWVCTFEEFKGLSFVLRDNIIRISTALASQENKGEKMTLLYDFLTGNEFRLQIEGIVEGFTQLQADLTAEKRAMTSIWKRREKQIQKVLLNTNYMYSSIKGIAGNSVQRVELLELPDGESEAA